MSEKVTEVKQKLIPFDASCHSPVYDGARYVYFMQRGDERFGRVDLESFTFKELSSLSSDKFAQLSGGCFHRGNVYAVDFHASLCYYNVSDRKWNFPGIRVPKYDEDICVKLLNDPHNEANCIYMMSCYGSKGGLYRIDLDKRSVTLLSSPPVAYLYVKESLLVQLDKDEFIVLAMLQDEIWYCYSSKNGSWTPLHNWKPCHSGFVYQSYLVFSPSMKSFFYHINWTDLWETVKL